METRPEGEVEELIKQFDEGYYEGYINALKDLEEEIKKIKEVLAKDKKMEK